MIDNVCLQLTSHVAVRATCLTLMTKEVLKNILTDAMRYQAVTQLYGFVT